MSFQYRIGRSTVSGIIDETCQAIWEALHEVYLKPPSNKNDWKEISKEFEELWNFPHCLGAIDGILVASWHIYHLSIQTSVETAENIVKATVCLHNYLRQTNTVSYCPSGF